MQWNKYNTLGAAALTVILTLELECIFNISQYLITSRDNLSLALILIFIAVFMYSAYAGYKIRNLKQEEDRFRFLKQVDLKDYEKQKKQTTKTAVEKLTATQEFKDWWNKRGKYAADGQVSKEIDLIGEELAAKENEIFGASQSKYE